VQRLGKILCVATDVARDVAEITRKSVTPEFCTAQLSWPLRGGSWHLRSISRFGGQVGLGVEGAIGGAWRFYTLQKLMSGARRVSSGE